MLETALGTQQSFNDPVRIAHYDNIGPTAKGIMIGIFSVLGAAGFVLILAIIVYYFRYTQQGRIFLDRITRPGEYDDEQQFAKEEAEALEEMDDIQRTEYLRAKGMPPNKPFIVPVVEYSLTRYSLCASQPARIRADRYFPITVLGDTRERSIRMGIRTGAGNCQLLRGRSD